MERRLRDEEIGKMAGAEQRVVQEDGVAGPQGLDRVRRECVPHGEGHRAHVPGRIGALRHHPPGRIEDRDREILTLACLFRVRGAVHRRADLDGDRLERTPHDAEGDRIDPAHDGLVSAIRFAYSSTVAVTPGGRTVVDSRSSTIAGPVSDVPAASA